MAEPLRIALAGLGTVGAGLIRLLDAYREILEPRSAEDQRKFFHDTVADFYSV